MTREDVVKLFPDATDEQITRMLNQHNSEVQKEKKKTTELVDEVKQILGIND